MKEATHAVSILHAHALPEAQAGKLWARQAAGEGAHLKKWRLIIRNLAFQVRGEHACGGIGLGMCVHVCLRFIRLSMYVQEH